MLRRSQRGGSIIAALATASVAMGIFGGSTAQLQAQADEEHVPDLILLKDAAHVQMSGGQPVYDEFGLPIGLDSTADAPIGQFEVGDYVVYRINVLNRNYPWVNSFTVSDFLPEGVTYQNSWTRRCVHIVTAPTDHLWVRESQSVNPDESLYPDAPITFPCRAPEEHSSGTYDHCSGTWTSSTESFSQGAYSTLFILGRVDKKGAGKTISNTARLTEVSPQNSKLSVDSWTADITVAPLATGAQVEEITDPSPCSTPTPSDSPTSSQPSPSVSTSAPSAATSTPTATPTTSEASATTSATAASRAPQTTTLARTGVPLALLGGIAVLTTVAGSSFVSSRRKLD